MENTISHMTDVELPQVHISQIEGVFDAVDSKPFLEAIECCKLVVPNAPSIAASSIFFAENAENTFQLTQDEIAAINLYTIECNFYRVFNQTLRDRNRKKLIPFFPYLRHLLIGLNKLPSYNEKLWRGVKLDLRKCYPEGKKFFWWSFSSCTVNLEVLEREEFCGKSGDRTYFCISSQKGKDIKMFSNFADEREVLLMPGYFIVKRVMEPLNGLAIIDLEELAPPFDIFIGIPKTPIEPPKTTVRQYNFIRKFGSRGSGDGQFKEPSGVAVDGNCIYVSDWSNHRIQMFDTNGKFIRKFGSEGFGDGQFNCPLGVAVDGNIMVVDYKHHKIQIFG